MHEIYYVGTVSILVKAADWPEACDAFSAILSENESVVDWGYIKIGGQRLSPTPYSLDPEVYSEGDFIA